MPQVNSFFSGRENDSSEDALKKDPTTPFSCKDANGTEISSALHDLTDIHSKNVRPPSENSTTDTLQTVDEEVPGKYPRKNLFRDLFFKHLPLGL